MMNHTSLKLINVHMHSYMYDQPFTAVCRLFHFQELRLSASHMFLSKPKEDKTHTERNPALSVKQKCN